MRGRRAGSRLGSVVALALVLGGCAELLLPDRELARIGAARIDPCAVAFVVHGMLKDTGMTWDESLRDELSDRGRLALPVTYWSDPTGVWFGWGDDAPAREVARLADAVCMLHEASGCPVPLRLRALGFSQGADVVLEAAARTNRAAFDRVVLAQPATVAFSRRPRRLIESGRVGEIVVHWSPVDLVTLLAPLGAGSLTFWTDHPAVRHVLHWRFHIPPILGSDREVYARELFGDLASRPWSPARRAYARDLARYLALERSRRS